MWVEEKTLQGGHGCDCNVVIMSRTRRKTHFLLTYCRLIKSTFDYSSGVNDMRSVLGLVGRICNNNNKNYTHQG